MARTLIVFALVTLGWAPATSAQGAAGSSWWDAAPPPARAAAAVKVGAASAPARSASTSSEKAKPTTTLATASAPRSFWDEPAPKAAAPAPPVKPAGGVKPASTATAASASAAAKPVEAPAASRPSAPAPAKPARTSLRATPAAATRAKAVRVVFADSEWSDSPAASAVPAAREPATETTKTAPAATPAAAPAPEAAAAPAAEAPATETAAKAADAPAAPAAPAAAPAAPISLPTLSGAIIRVNDETSFRFGVLFQGQADWQQMAAGADAQQNLFLRRMRLMFGATIANRFSFFAETDNPNLGKASATGKTISSGLLLQDAFFGYRPIDNLDIWAGLIIIPLCRNCTQSATSLVAMDYGAFSFLQSTPTTSAVGRDTGFLARAYGMKKHLEVRLGAFQGVRQAGSSNGFRYAGRVQYSFGDPDVVQMFYGGSSFGAKRMVVVGAGFDRQDDYQAWAGDVTVDQRLGPGALYLQFDAIRYDGGTFLKTLPKQTDFLFEGAYYLRKSKFAPYVQVAMQRFDAAALRAGDQTRTQVGVSYLLKGNNANLKAGYLFVGNNGKDPLKGFTVQFQTFFY